MDPKKTSTLDPKLKEIYDRVMNSPTPQSPTPPPPTTKQPAPTPPMQAKVTQQSTQPPAQKPAEKGVQVFTKGASPNAPQQQKNGSGMLTFMIIIAGGIFFVIYGLFWVKFFKVNLPFTLPF